ncbi:hypothetical protein [Kribbella swartbergensis]
MLAGAPTHPSVSCVLSPALGGAYRPALDRLVVAAELAVEYFDAIEAPAKELHWFEKSAHMMPFEEPGKFNALLIDTVLSRPNSFNR